MQQKPFQPDGTHPSLYFQLTVLIILTIHVTHHMASHFLTPLDNPDKKIAQGNVSLEILSFY